MLHHGIPATPPTAACPTGKIEHATREAALDHQKSLVWANHTRGEPGKSAGLNVYTCERCAAWHVGHHDAIPPIYHYTVGSFLEEITASGVLQPRKPQAGVPSRRLRRLSLKRQRRAIAKIEPDPMVWFSWNPTWEYGVIKGYKKSGQLEFVTHRSVMEVVFSGLIRFVASASVAKLRWSDYLARNPRPDQVRTSMASCGNPAEWLATDDKVPIERLKIEIYLNGAWTSLCDVSADEVDAYLRTRKDAYAAAELTVDDKMARAQESEWHRLALSTAAERSKRLDSLGLTEPERILAEDHLARCRYEKRMEKWLKA